MKTEAGEEGSSEGQGGIKYEESGCLIHPERNKYTPKWDVLVLSALLFVCCWTPYEVTLMQEEVTESEQWRPLKRLNVLVDSVFICDMCLQFFLVYPQRTQRGTIWIFDRKKIAVHYLRGWFLIDFASVMPFDRLGAMMMSDDADSLDRSKFGDQRKPIFCRWFPPET